MRQVYDFLINPFILVFVTFPLLTVVTSALLYRWRRNKAAIAGAVFGVFTLLTYTVFNSTFFIWVLYYTALSYIVCLALGKRQAK